jgi:hypothetical protein
LGKPGVAPSDTFAAAVSGETSKRAPFDSLSPQRKLDVTMQYVGDNHQALLRTFRKKIDDQFGDSKMMAKFTSHSYAVRIRRAAEDIRKAQVDTKKFEIVTRLITESSRAEFDDEIKLMFNETVVLGLNVLTAITDIIDQFETTVTFTSPEFMNEYLCKLAQVIKDDAGGDVSKYSQNDIIRNVINTMNTKYNRINDITSYQVIYDRYTLINEAYRSYTGRSADVQRRIPVVENLLTTINAIITNAARDDRKSYDKAIQDKTFNIRHASCVNFDQMFGDLIDACTTVIAGTGGLVEWSEGAERVPRMSFSKLQSSVESLFADVKMFASLLGDLIPEVASPYLTGTDVGTVAYIENNLISKRFREDIATGTNTRMLDSIASVATKSFKMFCTTSDMHFADVFAERTHYAFLPDRMVFDVDSPGRLPRNSIGLAEYDLLKSGINVLIRSAPIETAATAIDLTTAIEVSKTTMRNGLWHTDGNRNFDHMNGFIVVPKDDRDAVVNGANADAVAAAITSVRDNYRKLYSQAGCAGAPAAWPH